MRCGRFRSCGTAIALFSSGKVDLHWSNYVVDEKKETNGAESKQDQTEAKPEKKSGFMKLAMYAGAALILTIVVAFGSYFFLAPGEEEVAETETTATETVPADSAAAPTAAGDELPDSLLDVSDPTVLDAIMENLAFMDYQPDESDLEGEEASMAVAESLEAVNWLESEKKRLNEWEKELNSRQRELDVLDAKVSKKVLTIEQAESSRIASLAKLYDGMDTRAVAQLMANLDDNTVVSILPRMKTKNASSVLSLMPSKRAARLSKQMITIAEK